VKNNLNKMKTIMYKFLIIILLTISFQASSEEWTGTVIGIMDGDTVKVLNSQKNTIKIRLTEIDAPEKNQDFGEQSKQSLSDICFKKQVIVDDKGLDKYKRTLGRLKCNGIDANAEQVKKGMAWAYRQYLTDESTIEFEDVAKTNKAGLWSNENPVAPWDFRHDKTSSKKITINNVSTHEYITGLRGGCYKITSSGNKRYVDHSFCKNNNSWFN